jgi:hypothetical protein
MSPFRNVFGVVLSTIGLILLMSGCPCASGARPSWPGPDAGDRVADAAYGQVTTALRDDILTGVRRQMSPALECYHLYEQGPSIKHRVIIGFFVEADGAVSRVTVVNPGTNTQLEDCIVGRVKSWRFPATGVRTGQYTVPLHMQMAE